MFEYDQSKKYGLPMDGSLRALRLRKYPVQLGEGIIMADQLESLGTIRIFESISGAGNVPVDAVNVEYGMNAVQVAEMAVSVSQDEGMVHLNRIYCEYGYEDELVPVLMEQLMNFADFYDFMLSSTIRKKHKRQEEAVYSRGKAVAKLIFGV